MSADLPDSFSHSSSMAMARVLVSYMDNPQAIRRRILEDFERAPSITGIERMRRDYLAGPQKAPEKPFKLHEGYYPAEAAERAQEATRRFVQALERERALSADRARAQGALDSPALRNPQVVDRAWDREMETAWLANGELGG